MKLQSLIGKNAEPQAELAIEAVLDLRMTAQLCCRWHFQKPLSTGAHIHTSPHLCSHYHQSNRYYYSLYERRSRSSEVKWLCSVYAAVSSLWRGCFEGPRVRRKCSPQWVEGAASPQPLPPLVTMFFSLFLCIWFFKIPHIRDHAAFFLLCLADFTWLNVSPRA